MFVAQLRRGYAQMISSGAQLLLVLVGLQLQTRLAWLGCLSLVALISVFAWLSNLYRLRMLRDTPTSTIAAAAQGQVELAGIGAPFCDPPLLSQLKGRPCLWCRYLVEEKRKDEWRTVDRGETSQSFVLRDRTGVCVVDPDFAEIVTRHHEQWVDGDQRYTEWVFLPGDALRVVGAFRTLSGSTEPFDTRAELSAELAEWKKDMPRLLARFDADRDGVLSVDEWENARRAAMQVVVKRKNEYLLQPETHLISRPQDGQFFLISNVAEDKLLQRYLLWGWAHLAILFAALGGVGWVWQH